MNIKYVIAIVLFVLVYKMFVLSGHGRGEYVVFINVGQGDSMYIHTSEIKNYDGYENSAVDKGLYTGGGVLIDAGPDSEIDGVLANYGKYPMCDFEMVLITHNHKDHFGGLRRIAQRCKIKNITFNDIALDALWPEPDSESLNQKIKNIKMQNLYKGDKFEISGWKFYILWPPKNLFKILDVNDQSLVIFIDRGNFEILITGDVSKEYLRKINWGEYLPKIQNGLDIYKVSHHGSPTGHEPTVIKNLHPINCLIGVGKNSFGHPDAEVVSELQDLGCRVFRTDLSGDMVFNVE